MTEKIAEYAAEGAEWPLAANILDPIRYEFSVTECTRVINCACTFLFGVHMHTWLKLCPWQTDLLCTVLSAS
jgi:hypothetical protein